MRVDDEGRIENGVQTGQNQSVYVFVRDIEREENRKKNYLK